MATRIALPSGPRPCGLGRNDERIEFPVRHESWLGDSNARDEGKAVMLAKVTRACLYARAADKINP